MRAFACPVCARLVTFESRRCLGCESELGFDFSSRELRAAIPGDANGARCRCANAELVGCNWLVSSADDLCASCVLTRVRPNDADPDGLGGLAQAEGAKRRLVYELAGLELPIVAWNQRPGGLAFDLLVSDPAPVTTGHADGVITLDLDETDPAHRERMRVRLGEPYRTVLGHLRHEIAHYYQPILVSPGTPAQAQCRDTFGDERKDYRAAMERYYVNGAPPDWKQCFVSAYATMHPWEDWAETFAHYLHIRDALQTAASYGVRVDGPLIATADCAPLQCDPRETADNIRAMLDAWLPLTYALNAVSRSMGTVDVYPFVLTSEIEQKLGFIDGLVRNGAAARDG